MMIVGGLVGGWQAATHSSILESSTRGIVYYDFLLLFSNLISSKFIMVFVWFVSSQNL